MLDSTSLIDVHDRKNFICREGLNMKVIKKRGIFKQICRLFINERKKEVKDLEFYLDLANKNPKDAKHRLNLAEFYHKNGEEKKELSESLLAAENLCNTGDHRKGLAIYKKILKKQPYRSDLRLKIAAIYKEMGFLEEAFSQYYELYKFYGAMALKDNASEIMRYMSNLCPEKFSIDETRKLVSGKQEKDFKSQETNANKSENDLQEPDKNKEESFFDLSSELESGDSLNLGKFKSIKIEEDLGFEKIIKEMMESDDVEKIYPNFNYQMGLVYKEMGFTGNALEQFQTSLKKDQKPVEATRFIPLCGSEKTMI
jgi:tetratricopeptide (TPR) repeat protein